MSSRQFKAESKRLLDLMINSIYTHKEIFLRELVSNASDALDKLRFLALTDEQGTVSAEDLHIEIAADRDARTLTITDNGIGMSKEELCENLGTIAKSGSLAFRKENEPREEIDIIGQFGVGFYAAFMVSSTVIVRSRKQGEEESWQWKSSGAEGYTVTPCDKESVGTEIILKIKDNTEEENYDEFLQPYRLQGLIKKYSDYIRYPIRMEMEHSVPKGEDGSEYETVTEIETVNSMIPIWKKRKSEVTEEEYNAFYKEKFRDFEDPLRTIYSSTEGSATYNALLFIPSRAPFDYYSKEYEKGLQLYASGVLIMDKCADLLPDHFSFVKGLVDSQDLSLNISREMLQHDRQLKLIAGRLEKKIKSELLSLLENDREAYEKFFKAFGLQLKYGLYDGFGANKELLQDLVMFVSSAEKKYVTLKEYVARMAEDQKYIYYVCGENADQLDRMPQTEIVKEKGYEILYLTDRIDEFAVKMLGSYEEKEFRSVSSDDLGFDPNEGEEAPVPTEETKNLYAAITEALSGKVKEVRASKRLKTHPVCLSTEGAISIEMEKVLNAMPNENKVHAERILELNEGHPVFAALKKAQAEDSERFGIYCSLLYDQALLIEGLPIEDPVAFSNAICQLIQ
ncbi:MAG: molecular chaperone HtpG [Oscillospiraceae bacterium]|nr:molecular chaperone HtpG [Oscillospiraceae bacterium]